MRTWRFLTSTQNHGSLWCSTITTRDLCAILCHVVCRHHSMYRAHTCYHTCECISRIRMKTVLVRVSWHRRMFSASVYTEPMCDGHSTMADTTPEYPLPHGYAHVASPLQHQGAITERKRRPIQVPPAPRRAPRHTCTCVREPTTHYLCCIQRYLTLVCGTTMSEKCQWSEQVPPCADRGAGRGGRVGAFPHSIHTPTLYQTHISIDSTHDNVEWEWLQHSTAWSSIFKPRSQVKGGTRAESDMSDGGCLPLTLHSPHMYTYRHVVCGALPDIHRNEPQEAPSGWRAPGTGREGGDGSSV